MTPSPALPRRALVLGLARTGEAVARVLARRGVAVTAADRKAVDAARAAALAAAGVVVRAGADDPAVLAGMDLVVPSPGVPADAPVLTAAVARGIPVWSEIELAFRLLSCPIVAITGTNGKSTTTSLVGLALARSGRRTFTGGNLGTPLVAAAAAEPPPEIAVAEVSSFQLEWVTRFRPRVAALLNLTPNHLDRHPTFAAYRDAKARVFAAQTPDDAAVLNRDDAETWRLASGLRARVVPFGAAPAETGAWLADGGVAVRLPGGGEERYDLGRTRLRGRHNVENVMAAATVARLAGATPAAVQEAIDGLEPLPHRLELVAERAGVRWIDDSKATNAGAAARSVEAVAGPVILLAGGLDKAGGYDPLVARARGKVRLAVAFGTAREAIATALTGGGVPVETVATLGEAVRRAADEAAPGDTVLLAPACASFDQFTDYAARGRAFRAAVEALP